MIVFPPLSFITFVFVYFYQFLFFYKTFYFQCFFKFLTVSFSVFLFYVHFYIQNDDFLFLRFSQSL